MNYYDATQIVLLHKQNKPVSYAKLQEANAYLERECGLKIEQPAPPAAPAAPVQTLRPSPHERALQRANRTPRPPESWGLTSRQCEVMRLLVLGVQAKQIAVELGVSLITIKNHLTIIYEAMGVKNNVAAAVLWDRHCRGEV